MHFHQICHDIFIRYFIYVKNKCVNLLSKIFYDFAGFTELYVLAQWRNQGGGLRVWTPPPLARIIVNLYNIVVVYIYEFNTIMYTCYL